MRARGARMKDLQAGEEKERQIGDGITRKAQWEDNGRIPLRFAPSEGAAARPGRERYRGYER